MTDEIRTKTRPKYAVVSTGTALGTATDIIDTSGYQYMQIHSLHGGTGGSRTINCYINAGTVNGSGATALPDPLFLGSCNSDQAGLGNPIYTFGSLTDEAILTFGTSTNLSFSVSYILFD